MYKASLKKEITNMESFRFFSSTMTIQRQCLSKSNVTHVFGTQKKCEKAVFKVRFLHYRINSNSIMVPLHNKYTAHIQTLNMFVSNVNVKLGNKFGGGRRRKQFNSIRHSEKQRAVKCGLVYSKGYQ